ncbi:rubrerythrin family protein [Halobium salinum]|uniref:Rubrerythrin family protein n=1 Tax=Halobium salinum TaxID=1364940 RepID=A0ABD5PDZ9_9EURY|nr:rubrerythrin family protein [Halobium salinum]
MDATEFREAVEAEKRTQLDRLGSNKLLVALTDAELDAETVLRAAANSEFAATNTFEAWADDEADDDAREAFAAVADQERDHYERVLDSLSALDGFDADAFEPADGGPMHMYLRGQEDTLGRVGGGLVGRGLVSIRTHTQIIGFFVNEPDERRADLFRDLKTETGEEVDRGLDLLDSRCETDADWERARGAAEYTIQVAYDDYEDALTGLGIDPRPIC